MNKKQLEIVKGSFAWAIKQELLRFETEPTKDIAGQLQTWLCVEYRNNLTAEGKEWNWKLLCAQEIESYKTPLELVNRITLMLAEQLRSRNQDVNILMTEK